MKLEDQVVSLEVARKLDELGIKQDSLFYWSLDKKTHGWSLAAILYDHDYSIAAYTATELLDYIYRIKIDLWIYHNAGLYLLRSRTHDVDFEDKKLVDAVAFLAIYLKANKLT